VTDQPESLADAIDERDVTLAVTPGQLLLIIIGIFIVIRVIRGLRRS
jgi:hypothetical protein